MRFENANLSVRDLDHRTRHLFHPGFGACAGTKFIENFNHPESVGLCFRHTEPRHLPYLLERMWLSAAQFFEGGVMHDHKGGEALFLRYAATPFAQVLAKIGIDGFVFAGIAICSVG